MASYINLPLHDYVIESERFLAVKRFKLCFHLSPELLWPSV